MIHAFISVSILVYNAKTKSEQVITQVFEHKDSYI